MKGLRVFKFGGTSLGSAARMREVSQLVQSQGQSPLVIVASAMSGVTNLLVAAAAAVTDADRGAVNALTHQLKDKHLEALEELCPGAGEDHPTRVAILSHIASLQEVLGASLAIGELTPRARDRVFATGEKLSVRLLAQAMNGAGFSGFPLDADTFLETDDQFGEATPLAGIADRTIAATLRPHLERGHIPIVTGFCGRAPDGATTTLGRGGSDLTATVIGGALDAEEVTLWSDVDGVFTSDPRLVPEARVISQLNFREAAEMSYYGAKVLHQRTMIPVAGKGIPVRSRNTMRPEAPGTVVNGQFTPGSHPVKAITAVREHALLSLEGKGMAGVPGVASRVFGALAERAISVTMISQSSSEASICFAVPHVHANEAEAALKRAFRQDLSRGDVEEVVVRRKVGLVAAVGLGMAKTPGVAAKVFEALGQRRVNILAIAQGSSELNISLAVEDSDVPEALRIMHNAFGLDRIDTGVDTGSHFDIILVGCGKVGRALMELIPKRRAHIRKRFGLDARVVAVSDRSGFVLVPQGIPDEQLHALVNAKANGEPLSQQAHGTAADNPTEVVRAALTYRLARPVVVDVTDAAGNSAVFQAAFALGADVVTANKAPVASEWATLQAEAAQANRLLKAEATVGAGLPVVETLEMLLATGDEVRQAQGCLSGTLGFLMTRVGEGALLSQAVQEAIDMGYTEPDPAVDLSGEDVARKATILGRMSGLLDADSKVELVGLVGPELLGATREDLFAQLKAFDEEIARKSQEASERGETLRFVATVVKGGAQVGLQAVPIDSPLGMLKGTDNMIVFHSDRYDSRPLVVSGPGAGIDVTAMGVLGDILRVAGERR